MGELSGGVLKADGRLEDSTGRLVLCNVVVVGKDGQVASEFELILGSLPASMRRRVAWVGKYSREAVQEQLERQGLTRTAQSIFLRTHMQDIQTVVLIACVSRLIKEGIQAAELSIQSAVRLGKRGIAIGSTVLEEGSAELDAWRKMDADLDKLIQTRDLPRLASNDSFSSLIYRIVRKIGTDGLD